LTIIALLIIGIYSIYFCIDVIHKKYGFKDYLQPGVIFLILLSLYSLSYLTHAKYFADVDSTVTEEFSWAYIISVISFVTGYIFINPKLKIVRYTIKNLSLIELNNKKIFFFLLRIVLLFSIISLPQIVKYIQFNPESYVETAVRNRINTNNFSAPLSIIFELNYSIIISLFLYKSTKIFKQIPKIFQRMIGISLTIWISLYTYLSGSKSKIIITLLILIIPNYYNLLINNKKFHLTLLYTSSIIILILLWPLLIVQTHIRYTSNIFEMSSAFISYITNNPISVLPIASSELIGCSKTFATIISKINENVIDFNYGIRWINDFLIFIPKLILNNRTLPSSEYFVQLFFPDLKEGAGLGWFILNDGYWAFGLPGVGFISLVYGYLLRLNYEIIMGISNNSFVLGLYQNLYFVTVITSVRTGIFGSIKIYLINLLSLFFIVNIYKLFYRKTV
tara:strand:- start:252 stop:1601 length:1350 start_codon:yes stop_codon:yes gene_type:complete